MLLRERRDFERHPLPTWADAACGAALATIIWGALTSLCRGLPLIPESDVWVLAVAPVGAFLYVRGFRQPLCAAALAGMAAVAVVAFTPLSQALVGGLVQGERDPLVRAPAVVVLAAGVHSNGGLNPESQARILRAYSVLRAGLAPVLVLTQGAPPKPSWIPTVRNQMAALRFSYPIVDAGRVWDTHDEAVSVARIARARGWKRIILVTHPTHMRRAAGTFRKVGLAVERAPCTELRYAPGMLESADERLWAFRQWLHETVGIWAYHRRGWL